MATIQLPDADGYVVLTTGGLEQIIEAPDLAGKQVTLAADTGGTTVNGEIEGQTGNLPLTVTLAPGDTGNITVRLEGGKVKNLRLIEGASAGSYQPRPQADEIDLCERYYQKSYAAGLAPGTVTGAGARSLHAASTNAFVGGGWTPLRQRMRASPTVTYYAPSNGSSGNIDQNSTPTAATPVTVNDASAGYPQMTAGSPALADFLTWHYTADAEL